MTTKLIPEIPKIRKHQTRHLVISLSCIIPSAVVLAWIFFGCTGPQIKAQHASMCFNQYQEWFTSLDETIEFVDLTLTVRIRAFGNEAHKQAAWKKDWLSKYPSLGPVSAGCCVSSKIPEVWINARMSKKGLVLNPAILGHEIQHAIHNADRRVVNPDQLVNEDIF